MSHLRVLSPSNSRSKHFGELTAYIIAGIANSMKEETETELMVIYTDTCTEIG